MRCFAQESRLGSNNSLLVETTTAEAAFSMTPHMDLLHFPLITAQFAVINGLISKNGLGWGWLWLCVAWGMLGLMETQLGASKAWELQFLTAERYKSCFTWHEGKISWGCSSQMFSLGGVSLDLLESGW